MGMESIVLIESKPGLVVGIRGLKYFKPPNRVVTLPGCIVVPAALTNGMQTSGIIN